MNDISVVLLTYNRAAWLERALRGALAQTRPPLEIIVVDNGSTDGTPEVLRRAAAADPRVRVLTLSAADGISAARNAGASLARGTYLAFLDDDDQWHPTQLEQQVQRLADHPEAVLVYVLASLVDDRGRPLGVMPAGTPRNTYAELCRADFICGVSVVLLRAEAFRAVGGFRPSLEGAEDYDLWLRLSQRGRILAVTEPLTTYQRHAQSFSRNHIRSMLAQSRALSETPAREAEGITKAWLKQRAALLQYEAASQMVDARQFFWAGKAFLESVRLDPLVGLSVRWAAHHPLPYRVARPALAAGYCLLRGTWDRRAAAAQNGHGNSQRHHSNV
jgi:glycosyltransferase involved in cell wall biosynthesis